MPRTTNSNSAWNVSNYTRYAAFVPIYGESLLESLKAQKGETILDLGCGEGSLTRKIMQSGASVTGIDADSTMVAAACKAGVYAYGMSAADMAFDSKFDAVFSNAALHWMKPPETVARTIHRALKPGGRFIGEMGGQGNVESARRILVTQLDKRGVHGSDADPWYFPSAEDYKALLQTAGFDIVHMELYPRPTPLGDDVKGWLQTFGGTFMQALPQQEHDAYLEDSAADLRAVLPHENGQYLLDYVRLRFFAVKP